MDANEALAAYDNMKSDQFKMDRLLQKLTQRGLSREIVEGIRDCGALRGREMAEAWQKLSDEELHDMNEAFHALNRIAWAPVIDKLKTSVQDVLKLYD